MAEEISLSIILPPPMLSEQVLHLKGRKATEKMPAGGGRPRNSDANLGGRYHDKESTAGWDQ
jgi:hypothetical protein